MTGLQQSSDKREVYVSKTPDMKPVLLLVVLIGMIQGENKIIEMLMSTLSGDVDRKLSEMQNIVSNDETQENVMMEMGMELLLKEPVIKKVD